MKTVILAGGLGTRLAEETDIRPKPMVEIGGYPILWHIMNIYAAAGFNEFVIALGYKGEVIKDYFFNYNVRQSDFSVRLIDGTVTVTGKRGPDWTVHLIDTGSATMTGGRIRRVKHLLGDEPFMVTYGDGVARIDIGELVRFHRGHRRVATLTGVRPPSRFGSLVVDDTGVVREFIEKPQMAGGWINGGFFVFEPQIFDYLDGDDSVLERGPLETLVKA
ncbi:MAG TPA: glucose-1-phosphate cytidylyltransferase, partial [Candidatus Baltobacteraceae bacterium]|nr:glucose-1-phosphate cytidylyltransferase [Candidatus Baltobacteraceae bacterium]